MNGDRDNNSDERIDGTEKEEPVCNALRKRKRSLSAHGRGHRASNHTSKQHLQRATRSTGRQNSSSSSRLRSDRLSVPEDGNCNIETRRRDNDSDGSSEENSKHGRLPKAKRRKLNADPDRSHKHGRTRGYSGVQPSPFSAKSVPTLPTPSQLHALPAQAQRQLPSIVIYPVSSSKMFLTAIFRDWGDMGMLSTSQAVSLIENHVGRRRKLENITITLLTPDTWFLACFLYSDAVSLSASGSQTDQPAPASLGLLATRTDSAAALDDNMSSDGGIDGESMNGDTPSIHSKRKPWTPKEDANLRKWKDECRPWGWICGQFKSRSPGAVKVHWCTKLQGKA
jgi:hypothetical protein